jgi:hypothetical protein
MLEPCCSSPDAVAALENALEQRLHGRVRDLRLHLSTLGWVLEGRASTYHSKQLAQHHLMALTAMPIRANDIQVQ